MKSVFFFFLFCGGQASKVSPKPTRGGVGGHAQGTRAGCPGLAAGPALTASPPRPRAPPLELEPGTCQHLPQPPLGCPRLLGSHTDTGCCSSGPEGSLQDRVLEVLAVGRGLLSGFESIQPPELLLGPGRPSFANLVVTDSTSTLRFYHLSLKGKPLPPLSDSLPQ